jgi:hypothetical protein
MVRMNLFQRLTRCWDQLHPYNAAQAMRLSVPCTHSFAQRAWDATLTDLGVGAVHVHGRRYHHSPAVSPLHHLPIDADPEQFLSDQLNTPFDDHGCPFRPFLQSGPQGTLAGIVYHHWVADSVSIRLLMREWFCRMTGCGQPRRQPLPLLCDETPHSSVHRIDALLNAYHLQRNLKSVRRLPRSACGDLRVEHRLLRLPDGTAQLLRHAARRRGVKVTDLLLCTLAEVCDRHLPSAHSHRPDLALGSIRDIRPASPLADPDAFGAALAFAPILCPASSLSHRDALLSHIARQTTAHRNQPRAAAHESETQLALLALNLLPRSHAAEFFRKRMPFSAGLSNVDLSRTWVTQHPQVITGFYRVSPAGPALPLVITPTTIGQQFTISLTWRKSVFSQTTVETIANDLRHGLAAWLESTAVVYEPAA